MARYRLVETRFWTDAKVRALSKPQPCGQFLLFRLMTGPETIIIPGVIVTTRAGLAEKLGWDPKGFGKAFAELSREGWAKACWDAGLVWLPTAIKHNSPANPNVVKGWAKEWPEIPECSLKGEILQALREHIEGLGEGFAKAFAERFPDGYRNQEQDTGTGYRTQEQERESPAKPATRAREPDVLTIHEPEMFEGIILAEYMLASIRRHTPGFRSRQSKAQDEKTVKTWAKPIRDLIKLDGKTPEQIRAVIDRCHNDPSDDFEHGNVQSGAKLRKRWDNLWAKTKSKRRGHSRQPDLSPLQNFDFHEASKIWGPQ